jgi:transposase
VRIPHLFMHKLKPWERHRLHCDLKKARAPRYRDRLDAILLSAEGWSISRIARVLGKDYCTVRLWLMDFNRLGFDGIQVQKPQGAPRRIDTDGEACLQAALSQNPRDLGYRFTRWTLPTLAEHLYREVHVRVSSPTLSRTLRRLRYRYKRPKHSLKHRQNRHKVKRVRRERDAVLKKSSAPPNDSSSFFRTSVNFISIPA